MKKILMILTMALAATSCMDILDVAPEDQIASENMWTTEELADKGMAGLYFPFYATQLSSTQLRRADGLNRQGTTIIIVTHSQRDAKYAHRVIQLLDGQIVAENINRPLEKKTSSKNETV